MSKSGFEVVWKRRFEGHLLARRDHKSKGLRVERKAAHLRETNPAATVERITENRMVNTLHMNSNLVRAACFGVRLKIGKAPRGLFSHGKSFDHSLFRHRIAPQPN